MGHWGTTGEGAALPKHGSVSHESHGLVIPSPRLQPRAPLSTGKPRCRILDGKNTDVGQPALARDSVFAPVLTKIAGRAWALERAATCPPTCMKQMWGALQGTAPVGVAWILGTRTSFSFSNQRGPSSMSEFCSDIRTHILRIDSFNLWNWKIFFNSVYACVTQGWLRIRPPPGLTLSPSVGSRPRTHTCAWL